MRVAEIYQSIQGEGFLTGTQSIFVRASGCNLRCWFCDTPHTSWHPEGKDLSVDEIVEAAMQLGGSHVVITGGEPMLFAEMIPICETLHQGGRHITIETAGTLFLPLQCDLMSISPKLASSAPRAETHPRWHVRHHRTRVAPDVIRRLVTTYASYQIKFVVDRAGDLREIEDLLAHSPWIDRSRVMLMPQGTDPQQLAAADSWLQPHCQRHGLGFCPRRQIEWFGMTPRT